MKSGLFLNGLARAEKPLVAAVQGLAVGIGVTMLLHCDLSYVADDAKLSTPFVNLGLVPEAASSMLLPARIGYARAFPLFALGEPIDGRTAAAIGLVTASAPAGEVRAMAQAAARKLASKPLGALKAMKGLLRDPAAIAATMQREGEIFGARLRSPEAAEAFRAFAERRAPDFSKFA
jgi:enoyl-CoA hydratase/carnithine racemase